jgi:hypothetical protein
MQHTHTHTHMVDNTMSFEYTFESSFMKKLFSVLFVVYFPLRSLLSGPDAHVDTDSTICIDQHDHMYTPTRYQQKHKYTHI